MKLKLEINDKERHILYRMLAVVLCILLLIMMTITAAYIGDVCNWDARNQLIAGFIASPIFYLIMNAVLKHYR